MNNNSRGQVEAPIKTAEVRVQGRNRPVLLLAPGRCLGPKRSKSPTSHRDLYAELLAGFGAGGEAEPRISLYPPQGWPLVGDLLEPAPLQGLSLAELLAGQ